jgi:hypothetical protein
MMMSQPSPAMPIEPFSVRVADEVLADLRARILNTRWPDPAPGRAWEQGTDLAWLRQVLAWWADEFDWRAHERHLKTLQPPPSRAGRRAHPLRPPAGAGWARAAAGGVAD